MKGLAVIWLAGTLCSVALSAQAGAWPRGKGKTFVASSASATWPDQRALELPDIYGSTYIEYGLSPRLTLGLDIGSADATRSDRLKAIGFLRYSLSAATAPQQFAIDAGFGTNLGQQVVRLGGSYGKGLQFRSLNSWISLEAYALRAFDTAQTAVSIDATYGVTLKSGSKVMGLLSAYKGFDGTQNVTFTPSFVHPLGSSRFLEVGITLGLHNSPDPALKFGIWQDF